MQEQFIEAFRTYLVLYDTVMYGELGLCFHQVPIRLLKSKETFSYLPGNNDATNQIDI